MAALVWRCTVGGCNSSGIKFVREDFLLPPSTNDVGPSTAIFFQGGEILLVAGVSVVGVVPQSVSFRFLIGRASLSLSSHSRSSRIAGAFEDEAEIGSGIDSWGAFIEEDEILGRTEWPFM